MIHSEFYPEDHHAVPFPSSGPMEILEPRPVILIRI